jgi:hypothetical protein
MTSSSNGCNLVVPNLTGESGCETGIVTSSELKFRDILCEELRGECKVKGGLECLLQKFLPS